MSATQQTAYTSTVRQLPGARVYWLKPTRSRHCGTLTYVCRTRCTDHTGQVFLWEVGCVYVRECDALLRAEFRGVGSAYSDKDCATLDEAKATVEASLDATPEPTAPCASAHGFARGQTVRIRPGYEFSGSTRRGEVVTQMHGSQPAWAVRCEFGGVIRYLRPDGIEAVPAAVSQPCQQQQAKAEPRRVVLAALATGLLAVTTGSIGAADAALRGDDGERLPDHAAFWSRLPLPFTPTQAWHLLSAKTQAEVGAAVIGMHLAQYVHGDSMAEADAFLDDALRDAACDVADDILNRMDDRLWALFPDLYGPDGDHPRWALDSGMVLPLGASPPEPAAAPAIPVDNADPIHAAIAAAEAARRAHQGIHEAGLDEGDDEQMARLDVLVEADRAAFVALAKVIPTTRDGDVALAEFYLRELDDPDGQATAHLEHLRNVLAGA